MFFGKLVKQFKRYRYMFSILMYCKAEKQNLPVFYCCFSQLNLFKKSYVLLLLFINIIINRFLVNIFLSWNEICTYSVVNYQHNFAHLIQEGSDSLFSYYNFLTYSTIVIWTCITILIKRGKCTLYL